ncbi:M23 family metallopeptidase [Aureimonas frigidaquae]|uniref:Membrane protein related to metallo endopeptidase n=1 Tax=Aureimonas frigidaquae TaxID=424757 RepID=A0A0P0Z1M6_9HYPH|nr:M23 family metallopeptidase [Aureimonas frigidaquae]BAT27864.1 membrane protein related to metallo endopeptidase [Aureimonas frigidaquae]
MKQERQVLEELGDAPALIADRRRRPDRRQVSARWLAGTLLTGVTSVTLMGIALSAAHEGHPLLTRPVVQGLPQAMAAPDAPVVRGERVFATAIPLSRSKRILEVPTMISEGSRDVIRSLPFAYVSMTLGARHTATDDYPGFDPMNVFAEDDEDGGGKNTEQGQIYGARVESDVRLAVEPFNPADPKLDTFDDIGTEEAEALLRQTEQDLETTPVQVAAFLPFDPGRFDPMSDVQAYVPGSAFRVIQENVSVAEADQGLESSPRYSEEIIPLRETESIEEALTENGYGVEESKHAASALSQLLDRDEVRAGEVLRLGLLAHDGGPALVRLSAYRGTSHLATVGVSDTGRFVEGPEPRLSKSVAQAFDENATEEPMRSSMPTVYDGIYQASLSYGLDDRLVRRLIRLLASDLDFQARLEPTDRLTVLYSLSEGKTEADASSDLLFVEARFGSIEKRYYRYWDSDSETLDYYDAEGRSSRQFMLRNPVPNGRFTSPFGSRRHPVLGYSRMHWGVDWAAPRGTPILASASGVVTHAGWTSGYGRQTVIKHANGYETSYSHQNSIAKDVTVGAKVRQGQVIGAVGSTGLSTGNHLHYEVSVNGQRVDPMRIRLPASRSLKGEQLQAFHEERERIDKLIEDSTGDMRLAGR